MFQSMMLEQQTSQLKIDDYDADVVDEFLKYLYTDQCSLDGLNSFGEQLLALADKYTIQQLKAQVEGHFIQYKLNKENCLKLLILSDMHQANLLKDFTIKFINTNLSIFEHGTSDWKTFRQSYPNLVADLYEKAVNLRIKR
ncbi:unnamed protein product [Didymodactylos carnosus]|uniref:BTB domain-containing protein n=1 Tax=Didymodactylos carnosus TaxID=1234261 RepID=A0A813TTS6_9BILA|nr:unnamed protein product [Didymodactylos carnosus]CAF3604619.1 unnamed protein product [Didymodactylos carnosus]